MEQIDFKVLIDADTSTIDAMKKKLEDLKASIGQVNTGSQAFKDLSASIKDTKTQLDSATKSSGETAESVKGLASNFSVFGVNVGGVISKLSQTRDNLKATAEGLKLTATGVESTSSALNVFKIALASTGIGLLVIALGSLITFLTQTQKGMDLVTDATARIGGVLKPLIGLASSLGEGLVNAFTHPVDSLKQLGKFIEENVVNRFKAIPALLSAVGDGFQALANRDFAALKKAAKDAGQALVELGTGLDPAQQDKIASALGNVTKAMGDQANKAAELVAAERKLQEERSEAVVKTAEENDKIAELRAKAAELALTDHAKQIQLLKEAGSIEEGQAKRSIALDTEGLRIQQARFDNNKEFGLETRKDLEEINQLKAKISQDDQARQEVDRALQKAINQATRQQNTEIATAFKKDQDDKKKAAEQAYKAEQAAIDEAEAAELNSASHTAEEVLNIKTKYNEQRKKLNEDDLAYQREISKKELDDKGEFNAKDLDELRRHEALVSQVRTSAHEARLADLNTAEARELDAERLTAQQKLDIQKKYSDLRIQESKDFLDKITAGLDDLEEKELEGASTSEKIKEIEDKYYALRLKAQEDFGKSKSEELTKQQKDELDKKKQHERDVKTLEDAAEQALSDLIKAGFDNSNKLDQQQTQARIQNIQSVLQAQNAALDEAQAKEEGTFKKKTAIQTKYDALRAAAAKKAAAEEKRLKTQQAEADKEAAVINAVINTAVAITKALPNIYLAAAAGIAGAVQIALIESEPLPQFSTGGLVHGPGTSTSDSIPVRLSAGESVINARSTAMFAPQLSRMNEAGGGKQFDFTPRKMAGGGVVDPDGHAVVSGPTADSIGRAVADAIGSLPPQKVYVTETDITLAQQRVSVIQNRARF